MSTVLSKTFYAKAVSEGSDSDSVKGKLSPSDSVVEVPTLAAPVAEKSSSFWRKPKHELDSVATQPSVFDDPVTLEVYRPPAIWENSHRFDPLARWTWREEYVSGSFLQSPSLNLTGVVQRIVRKIDLLIMVWACIMFFSLDLDRSNISQANTDNFLNDLGLTTNDFNLGNTLFKVRVPLCDLILRLY